MVSTGPQLAAVVAGVAAATSLTKLVLWVPYPVEPDDSGSSGDSDDSDDLVMAGPVDAGHSDDSDVEEDQQAAAAYLTYIAIEHKGNEDVRNWAVYWATLALLSCSHSALDCVLCWLPFYNLLKLGFLLALWHPNTQLALWLYDRSVGQLLGSNEVRLWF
ncbi:hypothetical protein OEZ85_002451 [Tetradesmus obliquus]|uniref:HVA22-like protein n=1 Tax=Tetradesmus obliquus TaxID=3088 RepID=A0ABY8TYD2_TETOB|nr:hypothetical protein OEZ85_002451 [Tetradesmus obliquus]